MLPDSRLLRAGAGADAAVRDTIRSVHNEAAMISLLSVIPGITANLG